MRNVVRRLADAMWKPLRCSGCSRVQAFAAFRGVVQVKCRYCKAMTTHKR